MDPYTHLSCMEHIHYLENLVQFYREQSEEFQVLFHQEQQYTNLLGTELNLTHEVINAMEIQLNQRTTQIGNMQIVREQEMQIILARVIDLCTAVIGITHPAAPFPPHEGETEDQNEEHVESESNSDVDFVMWEIAPGGIIVIDP